MNDKKLKKIAIVGTGPAGLMAATQALMTAHKNTNSMNSIEIHVFEKRPSQGRKLLIAGSSGLNISHDLPLKDFAVQYTGWNHQYWHQILMQFTSKNWISWIETTLGLETFLGTSDRYFVRDMKASNLLKKWIQYLENHHVRFHLNHELIDFDSKSKQLSFRTDVNPAVQVKVDAAAFFLGGASWENEIPNWYSVFQKKNIQCVPFEPSNVGFEVAWTDAFLKEAEGKPLKKVSLSTTRGSKLGELVITRYGLEGTPVYFMGCIGQAKLDLKPDLTFDEIMKKLNQSKENLSPIRRAKKYLALSDASLALLFHFKDKTKLLTIDAITQLIKSYPIELKAPRPLIEAISSKGGIALTEVNQNFELIQHPAFYVGGEMLDWDAPTGGFLIQACVTQGAIIGQNLIRYLNQSNPADTIANKG